MVRTLQAFFNGVSEPDGDRLDGSPKSLFIMAARLFLPSVITLRWSDRTRTRSVVRPHPPNGQPSLSGHAFSVLVCRYDPQGNYPNQLPYPAAQSSQLWVKKKSLLHLFRMELETVAAKIRAETVAAEILAETVAADTGDGVESSGDSGGDTSGDGGGGDTSGDSGAEILAETVAAEILAETVAEIKRGQMSPLFLFQFCIIVS